MAEILTDEHALLRPGLGRLKGKVAIITGANSGIGRATARLFGREGAKVVCCDIQETISPRIDQLIKDKEGGEALFLQCDVTKQEDLDNAVKSAVDQFGRVDILYNNAGAGIRKKIHEHTDEEWNFVLNTNLNAMFRGARAVMPHFIKQKSGNVVTTASTFGLLASPGVSGLLRHQGGDHQSDARDGARLRPAGNPNQLRLPRRHRDAALPRLPAQTDARRRHDRGTEKNHGRAATKRCCAWDVRKRSLMAFCF